MNKSNTKNHGNVRAAKKHGYTVVPNGVLPEGKKISARAWGLYVYLLSRPDGWKTHAKQLSSVFSEGVGAIYTALQNLVDAGLMVKVEYYEGGLKRQRYEQVSPEEILNSPDTDFRDLGNRDLENRRVTTTDITTTEFTQDHSTVDPSESTEISFHDNPFHEQSSTAHEKSSGKLSDDHLPKEQWNYLKRLLQATGEAVHDTEDFYSAVAQDRWEDFETALEDLTMDLHYADLLLDLVLNGKWTVNATVADWYEAGKELNTLFNTARAL